MRSVLLLALSASILAVEAGFIRRRRPNFSPDMKASPPQSREQNLLQDKIIDMKASPPQSRERSLLQEEIITYDDFESGFGNFAGGGGDSRVVSEYAHQGSQSLQLRDNSGNASSAYSKVNHDVTKYSELGVEFWFYGLSMETHEDFVLEYSSNGGSTWDIVKTWTSGSDFENGAYYQGIAVITEPPFDLQTTEARIRLRCDASNNNDRVYIDEVTFKGLFEGGDPLPSEVPSTTTAVLSTTTVVPSTTTAVPSTTTAPVPPTTTAPVPPITTTSVPPQPLTCPDDYCTEPASTMTPVQCDPTGVNYSVLDVFSYDGVDLIELIGPSDPAYAAAVVISVPHGGSLKPSFVSTRSTSHWSCPSSGCKTLKDSYTVEIANSLKEKFPQNFCRGAYFIINHLHRSKLDANRDIDEAAQGDPIAEDAWLHFHNFIQDAQARVINTFGTVTNGAGVEGARALLFDLHGYSGFDWDENNGSPFIQWGYRLPSSSLDPDVSCPVDTNAAAADATLSHAMDLTGHSLECLVRGPGSLGSRVSSLLDMGLCGAGLPSMEFPNPEAVKTDPTYCQNDSSCGYYQGGYDVQVHKHYDWQNGAGEEMTTVQAECPRCIRFDAGAREQFANNLSVALCSFLQDVFPANAFAPATC